MKMGGSISRMLGRIPMTTTIAAMVIGAVVLSVGAVVAAVYINLSANTDQVARSSQQCNIRTAATILGGMGGIQGERGEAGDVASIGTGVMRRFYN